VGSLTNVRAVLGDDLLKKVQDAIASSVDSAEISYVNTNDDHCEVTVDYIGFKLTWRCSVSD
jgi:hypothetical protein